MKDNRESFVFYRSFKESLSSLNDEDKLIMYEAIAGYALDRTPPNLTGFPKALFSLIKPQLDANWKRYEAGVANGWKGAEHGKKGGRPKKEKPSKNPLETQTKPSNVNVNDNDNVNIDIYPFEKFRNDYDKKAGSKPKLMKKWNNISDINKQKIKDHISRYKIAQPDKQFRKNPETYLNNESWNDEIINLKRNESAEERQYKQY
jgi:hypothetical protein